ncbi:MAG: acetamidase/formamidase family protein [Treponema sp.]|nr:acetamidase/formamidase family protein [Treponema sp.]
MQKVSKDTIIYAMSAQNKPVLHAEPGTQIQFEAWDALHGQIKPGKGFEGLDWSRVNPATGPVYINGAQAGDILSVKIDRIEVEQTGVVICGKGMGVMGSFLQGNAIKIVPIKGDVAHYSDTLHLPLNKMIGVIGVAPKSGEISCGVPDLHGGNMDCKEIREGATVLLPVNVPGALLAMGDLHALMADGEIGVSGVETGGTITVTVDIIRDKDLPLPMILNDTHVMTLASDADLYAAVEMATANMIGYLTKTEGFTMEDAVMLSSLVADVRICQVVDPKKTVRVEFPKKYLQN